MSLDHLNSKEVSAPELKETIRLSSKLKTEHSTVEARAHELCAATVEE
jgi:hypothetical protein